MALVANRWPNCVILNLHHVLANVVNTASFAVFVSLLGDAALELRELELTSINLAMWADETHWGLSNLALGQAVGLVVRRT